MAEEVQDLVKSLITDRSLCQWCNHPTSYGYPYVYHSNWDRMQIGHCLNCNMEYSYVYEVYTSDWTDQKGRSIILEYNNRPSYFTSDTLNESTFIDSDM